jgi:hypothetical protein
VLGPPLAWAFQLLFGYGIEEAACSPGSGSSSLANASRPATAVVTVVGAAISALAALAALRALRAVRAGRVPDPRCRVAFTAFTGLAGGIIFGALILLSVVSLLSLEACPT